jgi:quinol monooxygenase YgiN
MSHNSLFVFARISPKKEHFEDAKNAILNILQQTREEPGCRQFELHENGIEKALFLYEEWASESALEEHYQKPYTAAVFESYKEWLASPVNVVKMEKCAA